ncbi:hypothetical protein NC652_027864 [Populus alba x Populus x berolinensis]|nr:hypothetical protein NC652_027864 [Populus alba x Populus x berolinensis]
MRNSTDLFRSFGFDTQPHTVIPLQHLVSFGFNLVSRSFEFQADAFAKKLGYGSALRAFNTPHFLIEESSTMYLLHQIGLLPFTAATRNYCTTILTQLFICLQHEEGGVEERARDYNAIWMSTFGKIVKVLLRRNEVVLRCWEKFVNRFRHGSLVMHLTDSDGGQIPTVIFWTVINGVGGLSHEQWRSFNNEKKTVDAKNFLDGDLIETFLGLSHSRMEDIGKTMNTTVEELYKRVEELAKLY